MSYREFQMKVVRNDRPNEEGYWTSRIVPDVWPGDDKAQENMLREPPDCYYEPEPGYHVVSITEIEPGPSDQPGSMREMAGFEAGNFDNQPEPPMGKRF
jgi:hypothetical protein